jgi:hypothetical protein
MVPPNCAELQGVDAVTAAPPVVVPPLVADAVLLGVAPVLLESPQAASATAQAASRTGTSRGKGTFMAPNHTVPAAIGDPAARALWRAGTR